MGPDELALRALRDAYHVLAHQVLFRVDPEVIHEWTVRALAGLPSPLLAVGRRLLGPAGPAVRLAGIDFPGRVGVAAGLDKDGLALRAWQGFGFGFVELGTVTARPQPGNPPPRLVRLRASGALLNRMGFNNEGAAALASRLAGAGVVRGNGAAGIPVGVSIGKTKRVPLEDAVADYLTSLEHLAPHADYLAVNVSSPNTPGLRALQGAEELAALLGALTARARALAPADPVPLFVKVAPDLDDAALEAVVGVAHACGVAGFIATNTTVERTGVAPAEALLARQDGGLSGAPLTLRTRTVVRRIAAASPLPVIGVGGVMSPADAAALSDAGAALVQVYTGFIYHGPALVAGINRRVAPHGFRRECGDGADTGLW